MESDPFNNNANSLHLTIFIHCLISVYCNPEMIELKLYNEYNCPNKEPEHINSLGDCAVFDLGQ